jgi:hypothetical protein
MLQEYQGQVDALDQQAAQARAAITAGFAPTELANERTAAANTGGAGALAASRGLAGSAFGDALISNADMGNQATAEATAGDLASKLQASDQTYATQKEALTEFIQGEADKETTLRQNASEQGADAKVTEIQNRTTRAQASAQASASAMISAGVTDPSNPNYTTTINQIASATGLSAAQVTAYWVTAKNAAAATAASQLAAENTAAVAGNTTLPANSTEVGPDGKVIATGATTPTSIPIAGGVAYAEPGTGSGGTSAPVGAGAGGAAATSPTPVTLPPPTSNSDSPSPTSTPPNPNANAPVPGDSHLPVAQTINGKTYDANGDPTTGPVQTNGGAILPTGTPASQGGGSGAAANTALPNGSFGTWQSLGISASDAATLAKIGQTPSTIYSAAYSNILAGTVPGSSGTSGGMGSGAALGSIKSGAISQAQQQVMKAYGITNADLPAIASAEGGLASANATAIENKATITQYIAKTSANLGTLQNAIGKYGDTNSPIVNQALQVIQGKLTGNAQLTGLTDALTPFLDEYAKVMNGSTGSVSGAPVSTQAQAAELLSTLMNKGQLSTGIAVMEADMAGAINSVNGNVISSQNQIQNVLATFAQGKGVQIPSTPEGTAQFSSVKAPDGTSITLPNALYVGDAVALTGPTGQTQLYTIEPDQTLTPL